MDICINEHHGYFTLDMGCYQGHGFDNETLQNTRFSLIFIPSGSGSFHYQEKRIPFDAPVVICANESEFISIPKDVSVTAILFHPSILNSALNFHNVRNASKELNVTQVQDCFYLHSFLKRVTPTFGILFPNSENTLRITKLFQEIFSQTALQDNDFWACRSRSCLIELLSLTATISEEKQISFSNLQQKRDDEILSVITYLKSNLHKKITISDLTKEFHKNRTDLSKEFIAYTGETIVQFLNKTRIDMAATLLRDTLIPILEIMERVGFQDYSYFSRTFKKEKGISPKHYREQYCWMLDSTNH